MPSPETIQQIKIRNVIGEKTDLPSLNARVSLTSRIRALVTKFFGVPQLIHQYGALGLNKTITMSSGENQVMALFTDGTYLYAGLNTSPGKIVKIDLSDFVEVSTLTLDTGENKITSLVSDGTSLYAGLNTNPGKVVKINLLTFTKTSTLTFATNINVISLVSTGVFLYAGLTSPGVGQPGKLVKINLDTFTEVSSMTPNPTLGGGENSVSALFADTNYIYAGLATAGGVSGVVKIDANTFSSLSTLSITTSQSLTSLFPDGIYLYAGLASIPGAITKIDLNTFTIADTLTFAAGEDYIYSMVADATYIYASLWINPGQIIVVDINTFKELCAIIFDAPDGFGQVLLSDGTYLYTGTYTSPGKIVRRYLIPAADMHQRRIESVHESHAAITSKTTSNGNAGGTTLIDSTLTQANNYWNGMMVLILSGNSKGQSRRISAFDNATGTITVDTAFNSQILSGTKYKILPNVATSTAGGDATAANQTLILNDIGDASASTLGSIYAILGNPAQSLYASLSGAVSAVNRIMGKRQVLEVSVTSAANAGSVTLATITTQPCVIEKIIIHANAAQTADLTTCAVTGGASGVVTFISTSDATQANLNAADKQIAWQGAVRLATTKTIAMNLVGTGATAVNLTVTITYYASVNGGYLA